MSPNEILSSVMKRQEILWKDITRYQKLSKEATGRGPSPLSFEIDVCVQSMTMFFNMGDQNLNNAKCEDIPDRVSFFGLLNSIVLNNVKFESSFKSLLRTYFVIEQQRAGGKPLNDFENCIVGIVLAVQDLETTTRKLNRSCIANVTEAHENASAMIKLKNLMSLNFCKRRQTDTGTRRFRDFDSTLCSNQETSILDISAFPKKEILGLSRFVFPQASLGARITQLARSLEALEKTTKVFARETLSQAQTWHAVMDTSNFSYGVDRYVEKCHREVRSIFMFCDRINSIVLLLMEAGKELNFSNSMHEPLKNLVDELLDCVLSFVVMTYWWWYQEAIGVNSVKKLRCLEKLATPIREQFQSSEKKNQDIIEEFERDVSFFATFVPHL